MTEAQLIAKRARNKRYYTKWRAANPTLYDRGVETLRLKLDALLNGDRGYIAALLDGEGYISMKHLSITPTRKRQHTQATIGICNTSVPLMEWLERKLGCYVRWRDGIPHRNKPNGPVKRIGYWKAHGRYAAEVLKSIEPWLIIKREKARLVLELYQQQNNPGVPVTDVELERRHGILERFVSIR